MRIYGAKVQFGRLQMQIVAVQTRSYMSKATIVLFLVLIALGVFVWLQEPPVSERVDQVEIGSANESWIAVVTVFRPKANGRYPLLVLNHGQDSRIGEPKDRLSYGAVARFFARRGYVVIVPMRPGFGGSSGRIKSAGCENALARIRAMSDRVGSVVEHYSSDPAIDHEKVVFAGVSMGALVSLGLAADERFRSRTLAVLAFAPVMINPNCDWQRWLHEALGTLGREVVAPSIWFVGESDPWLPSALAKSLFSSYFAGGLKGEFHELPISGIDGHDLLNGYPQLPLWWPYVERFLQESGLPTRNR